MKYFEKEYDVKRVLLLKAHAGAYAQGEWDIERWSRALTKVGIEGL